MTNSFIKILKKKIVVTLPSNINFENFENILKLCYQKIWDLEHTFIVFDLSKVSWFDNFYLSLFSLWILELKSAGKQISLISPTDGKVKDFLKKYHFNYFAKRENINYPENSDFRIGVKKNLPYIPLIFADEIEFWELVQSLDSNSFFSTLFSETIFSKITQKGAIKDILITEVGDNMYNHGGGRFANLIMIRFSNANSLYLKNLPLFEKNFFLKLNNKPYITLIISDKGPGIFATLRDTYLRDEIIVNKKGNPDEADIIEYAFMQHSSRRSVPERLSKVAPSNISDTEGVSGFTGLFQVKEIVKLLNGSMLIRSGKSFVYYDYYNYNQFGEAKFRSTDYKEFNDLTDFGGVQYKITIPIITENIDDFYQVKPKFDKRNFKNDIELIYLRLDAYFKRETKFQINGTDLALKSLSKALISFEHSAYFNGLIIDFTNHNYCDSKVLIIIICKLMRLQHVSNKPIIIRSLDSSIASVTNSSLETQKTLLKSGISIFNDYTYKDIIGIPEYDRKIYKEILKGEVRTDEHEQFVRKYSYLFVDTEVGFRTLVSRFNVLRIIKENLTNELNEIILKPENKVYHRDKKVLLSSNGLYFESYFEIYSLVSDYDNKSKVFDWISFWLMTVKPVYVLSVSKLCYDLIEEIRSLKINRYTTSFENILVENSLEINELEKISYKTKDAPTLVFNDVVATGNTIKKIINSLEIADTSVAISIVNCSGISKLQLRNGNEIKLFAITNESIPYYTSKPNDWTYDEIYRTDEATHRLIERVHFNPKKYLADDPLKQFGIKKKILESNGVKVEVYVNNFFDFLVKPYKAYLTKVISHRRFMPVMFDIRTILNVLSDDIAYSIWLSIQHECKKLKINPIKEILSICSVYYGALYDLDTVINLLRRDYLPKSKNEKIHVNILDDVFDTTVTYEGKGIVLIEDAFCTGENIFKLIEYFERKKAKYILIYVIIKRGAYRIAQRLSKISEFGNSYVRVNYLFDAEIPVYNIDENPIDKKIAEYEYIKLRLQKLKVADFVNRLIENHSYARLDDGKKITEYSNSNSYYEFLTLRWLLEMAKSEFLPRRQLLYILETATDFRSLRTIISILAEEKDYFLKKDENLQIFYGKLRDKIVSDCRSLLSNIDKSESDIIVYEMFIILYYLAKNEIFQIIRSFIIEENLFHFFLPIIVFLESIERNNENIKAKLELIKYLEEKEFSREKGARISINILKKIWEKDQQDISQLDFNDKVNSLRIILKSTFHNFQRNYETRSEKLRDIDSANEYWISVKSIINVSFEHVDNFLEGNQYINKDKFAEVIEKLFKLLKEGEQFFNNQNIDSKNYEIHKDDFELILAEIMKTIFDAEKGLLPKLEKCFSINLKKAVQFHLDKMKAENYKIEYKDPPASALVFCELDSLHDFLDEIFVNIKNHSEATSICVEISKFTLSEKEIIKLEIMDNGSTNKELKYKIGLEKLTQKIGNYGGEFTINRLQETDAKYGVGYRTIVTLYLYDLSEDILNNKKYANS